MIQEPIQPTSSPDPATRRGAGTRRDALLLVGLIIAVLIATSIAIAVGARSQDPDRTLATGASAAPATSAAPDGKDDGQHADKKPKVGKGFAFQGGGPGRGRITIKAIDGDRLSLATPDGWTRTIAVTSTTVITKGGQTIAVTALKVGDEVRLRQVRNADGSYTVTGITVPTAQLGGEVTAVAGTTITVKGKRDATRVITVNGSTVYKLGTGAASKSDVKVGSEVTAAGTLDGDTFTAITVWIARPSVAGEVTGKTADTITVKRKDGVDRDDPRLVDDEVRDPGRQDRVARGHRRRGPGDRRGDPAGGWLARCGHRARQAGQAGQAVHQGPEGELRARDERGPRLSTGPSGRPIDDPH